MSMMEGRQRGAHLPRLEGTHMPRWKGPFQEGQALAAFVGVLWVALADWVGVLLWGSRLPLPVWPQHHALLHSQLLQNLLHNNATAVIILHGSIAQPVQLSTSKSMNYPENRCIWHDLDCHG